MNKKNLDSKKVEKLNFHIKRENQNKTPRSTRLFGPQSFNTNTLVFSFHLFRWCKYIFIHSLFYIHRHREQSTMGPKNCLHPHIYDLVLFCILGFHECVKVNTAIKHTLINLSMQDQLLSTKPSCGRGFIASWLDNEQ